ncbi:VirB4 family type IV secretion/conjugal transfer ATPase [Phenylobacterium sp.]|uniref:VirB4 family type IV secretion/conjugal transfer ATPase n=1 Tax=Phenylobacterium sp. TaxID=1871053 RepID=UPI002731F5DF|nr:VirB4 family type IV secretion/conjugal transfer ATPase [Phenylobacterium sp.]MDP1875175.1 VirB4 family type IV secretion/conjugal transfer ATPase [Phenylobacterium sp.]
MASRPTTLRSAQRRAPSARARIGGLAQALPYVRHITDEVVGLETQALMVCLQLEGASFETADLETLNDEIGQLNNVWRNIADDRLALWHHIVRRPYAPPPPRPVVTGFSRALDDGYRARLGAEKMFLNELFLTLVWKPPAETRLNTPSRSQGQGKQDEARSLLERAAQDLSKLLARYSPRTLSLYEADGLTWSEPLELINLILTGEPARIPLIRGRASGALTGARLIFGREALEVRQVADASFAGVFSIKEYPARTRPGMWDGLLRAPYPLVISHSFTFLSKASATALMERKQRQFRSTRDRAGSQVEALGEALDDLVSNRFVMGEHHASVLVRSRGPADLAQNLADMRARLADTGMVAVREDLGLQPAFWAQFPGQFSWRPRPAPITSRNFAAFAPFHTYPTGQGRKLHWGAPVTTFRSSAGSPFEFSFHVADVGHTFICGPTGSGKTVVQNFLLGQLERLGPRQILIDKDRGGELFIRARGGAYLDFAPDRPSGLAPLKTLSLTPSNRAFLGRLVAELVGGAPVLTPRMQREIDSAIAGLEPLAPQARSFAALRSLMVQGQADGISQNLAPWCAGQRLGWVLDGDGESDVLQADIVGFDITRVLDEPQVRTPLLMCLLHRLHSSMDGRRLVIDIDEFWKALGDEAFRGLAQDGLKTYRKQNAFLILATQSPADVLRSPIAHTLLEQCPTKIYLPNPLASESDYIEGFGLTEKEFRLVREEMAPGGGQFLIKQGRDSVVVSLDLAGMDDEIAILSGRAETVALAERLRAELGEPPQAWLTEFHKLRRSLP